MANLYYIDDNGQAHYIPVRAGVDSVNGMTGTVEVPVPVKGVSLAGTALTPNANGVVNVPIAESQKYGITSVYNNLHGLSCSYAGNGVLSVSKATDAELDARTNIYKPVVPNNLDYAVKAAMTDGKGAAWSAAEQAAACERIGAELHQQMTKVVTLTTSEPVDEINVDLPKRFKNVSWRINMPTSSANTQNKFLSVYGRSSANATSYLIGFSSGFFYPNRNGHATGFIVDIYGKAFALNSGGGSTSIGEYCAPYLSPSFLMYSNSIEIGNMSFSSYAKGQILPAGTLIEIFAC